MKNEFKAIIGIYSKRNTLINVFEDRISANNYKNARAMANETRKALSKEYERKAMLLSLTLIAEKEQSKSNLPF